MAIRPSLGRTVRYVGPKEQIAVAIITNVHPGDRVNLAIVRDGVNQAELPDHVYEIDYAPVDPAGAVEPNTWHWPAEMLR